MEGKEISSGCQSKGVLDPSACGCPRVYQVQDQRVLSLVKIGGLNGVPQNTKQLIVGLEGSLWEYHPECGFPEIAVVQHGAGRKTGLHPECLWARWLESRIDPVDKASPRLSLLLFSF